jgi:hypothetical protein
MGYDLPTDQELDRLQWTTVLYDLHETNPETGREDAHDRRAPLHLLVEPLQRVRAVEPRAMIRWEMPVGENVLGRVESSAVAWGKVVRTSAATGSRAACGTVANRSTSHRDGWSGPSGPAERAGAAPKPGPSS